MPIKEKKVHVNDAPWMTNKLKSVIKKRQKALNDGNKIAFKYYRNQVNSERKKCRQAYFHGKIKNLKHTKPKDWWSAVKKISGMDPLSKSDIFSNLQVDELDRMTKTEIANKINDRFLEPLQTFQSLNASNYVHTSDDTNNARTMLSVSEEDVYKCLKSLNPSKSSGPDDIPSWFLKEFAELLSLPVSNILNCSYEEQHLPPIWKMSNTVPIPKSIPVQSINKHLRPISLTPILSKIAEEFVIREHLKPAVLEVLDPNQFGVIPGSSTSQALVKMIHKWTEATDGNGSSVRVILFDYQKAFDYVDHTILLSKLKRLRLPTTTLNWIIDFLSNRQQRVKLGNECFSEWGNVPAGVPQGTKLGPWLFLIMINDLRPTGVDQAKFVDDLTISETVSKSSQSVIQVSVTNIQRWSDTNLFRLHDDKCKELRIDFKKTNSTFSPILVNGKPLEVVQEAKLLGLTFTSDLKWNNHVNNIVSKCSKRLYLLVQLKRAKVPNRDIIQFYKTCIRPVLEYVSIVFHHSLPKYLSEDMERVQKRAHSIVYPGIKYEDSLVESGLLTLHERRNKACEKFFNQILEDTNHKLFNLISKVNLTSSYILRNVRKIQIPKFKTERYRTSFLIASSFNANN